MCRLCVTWLQRSSRAARASRVPAYMQLYGDFVRKVGHFRRYTPTTIRSAVERAGLRVRHVRPVNFSRRNRLVDRGSAWRRRRPRPATRLALRQPSRATSRTVEKVMRPAVWAVSPLRGTDGRRSNGLGPAASCARVAALPLDEPVHRLPKPVGERVPGLEAEQRRGPLGRCEGSLDLAPTSFFVPDRRVRAGQLEDQPRQLADGRLHPGGEVEDVVLEASARARRTMPSQRSST